MKRLAVLVILLAGVPAFAGDSKTTGATTPVPAAKTPAPAAKADAKTSGPGTTAVKAANEKISALLKQKPAAGSKEEKDLAGKVTTSVRDFLDIDELGKRAMADQWGKLTAAQQTEFLTTLRSLIEDNYVKGLRANLSYTVDYTGESTDKDGNTVVTTTINTKRKNRTVKISVDYILKKQGDKLKAYDVKTDGVGLVDNYRTQFNKIVEKEGFNGLIARMKKKQSAT
ncbi:MAG TPA: ABC transporter substrate-binding protein [Kofleriaceae bacterium]|jgi:phospholipid transport system substrate-binding protein|nr:ABC transporter substrate-binding protein [Kofleriaceae bacterium]